MTAQITPICALLFGIAAGQVADSEAGPTPGTDQTDQQPADPGDEFPAIDWRDDQDAESDLIPMDPADPDQTDPGPPPPPDASPSRPPPGQDGQDDRPRGSEVKPRQPRARFHEPWSIDELPPLIRQDGEDPPKRKKKDEWSAGYKHRFYLKSPNNEFKLNLSGQVQFRSTFTARNDDGDINTRSAFELRRAKLKASGHLFKGWLDYSSQISYKSDTNKIQFETVWGRVRLHKDLHFKAGRFRPTLLREETVSTKRQLAVERSLVARTFSTSRTAGAALVYEHDVFRVKGGFFQKTDDLFEDEAWMLSGRAELLLTGKWKRLKDFTSFPKQKPTLALGAGIFYSYEDRNDPLDPDQDILRWTTDVSVELGGVNLFASLVGNHVSQEGLPSLDQYGAVVQGGVFLGQSLELFGRYEWGDADGLAPDLGIVTVGFNGYFDRHRLKFTADLGYGFGEVGSFWSSSGAGWRTDDPGENGQIVARAQLQVLF